MLRNSGTADSAVAGLDLESCPTGHEGLGIDPSVLLANSRCASGATGDQGGVPSIGTNRRERVCVYIEELKVERRRGHGTDSIRRSSNILHAIVTRLYLVRYAGGTRR